MLTIESQPNNPLEKSWSLVKTKNHKSQ